MNSLNARSESFETVAELRVDRDREVELFSKELANSESNIFVYGPRGVGKTFLAKLIYDHIPSVNKHAFPFFLSLSDMALHSNQGLQVNIKAQLLLQLVAFAWTNLLRRSYSELKSGSDLKGKDILSGSVENRYFQIYSALRYPIHKRTYRRETKAGITAIVKGELGEATVEERQTDDLLPFEYFAFLEEFRHELERNHGITKLVAICDEGNLLPLEMQSSLMRENIPIFRNKGLQFLFVGCGAPDELSSISEECFEKIEELNGIPKGYIPEFCQKRTGKSNLSFDVAALNALHKATGGNPRYLLIILSDLLNSGTLGKTTRISKGALSLPIRHLEERMILWKKEMNC